MWYLLNQIYKHYFYIINNASFQFTCLSDHPCTNNSTTKSLTTDLDYPFDVSQDNFSHRRCTLPQYISLAAAFAFLAVSVFLRYLPTY